MVHEWDVSAEHLCNDTQQGKTDVLGEKPVPSATWSIINTPWTGLKSKYASAVIAEEKSAWYLAWPSRYRKQVHAVLCMDASWHAGIERTLLLLCVHRQAMLRWKQGCHARFKSQSGEAIWVAYRSTAYCYNRGHQSKLCDNQAKQRYTPVRDRETYRAIHSMLLNSSTAC